MIEKYEKREQQNYNGTHPILYIKSLNLGVFFFLIYLGSEHAPSSRTRAMNGVLLANDPFFSKEAITLRNKKQIYILGTSHQFYNFY